MYDERTRERVFELLAEGYTPREVSKIMDGRPGPACISNWARGMTPVGKRKVGRLYTLEEKVDAVERVEAGEDYRVVAKELGCSAPSVLGWRRIYRQQGKEGLMTRLDKSIPVFRNK